MSNDNTKDRPPQVETRGSTIIIDGKEHRKAPPAETQPAGALLSYLSLLLRLHELIRHGQGDSAEADTVRDLMDAPWVKLTKEEVGLTCAIGASLSLRTDELASKPPAAQHTVNSIEALLHATLDEAGVTKPRDRSAVVWEMVRRLTPADRLLLIADLALPPRGDVPTEQND